MQDALHESAPPFLPPSVALRTAASSWNEIGASRWVLDAIMRGIDITGTRKPPNVHSAGYPWNESDSALMTAQQHDELRIGYIEEVTGDAAVIKMLHCVSPAFVVRKGNRPRKVLDYSRVNESIDVRSFRYETLSDLAQVLRPDDAMMVWDIKDAYHHLRLLEEDRTYPAFMMMGPIFVPTKMPFGLRPAPYIFIKVFLPLLAYLRSLGFRVISCVVYFGGASPAAPESLALTRQAMEPSPKPYSSSSGSGSILSRGCGTVPQPQSYSAISSIPKPASSSSHPRRRSRSPV